MMIVGLGLLVGLAAVEVAARLSSRAAPLPEGHDAYVTDVHLPFKPRPFSRVVGDGDEFHYDYSHNSLGFRDVEHAIVKGKATFRLLGLGDSFTYGVGVAFEETYLYRLEAMLNNRAGIHPKIEVIKAGIPRYFPEPERVLLEHYGVQFNPDLVLVGLLPNDVMDTHLGLDAVTVDRSGYLKTREANELGEGGMQIYRYSYLGRLLLRRYVEWRLRPREDEFLREGELHESDWGKMEGEFDKMAVIAGSIGAKLVILHIPQKGPWSEKSRYLPTRFAAWAASRDAHFVDALPTIERSSARDGLYYPKDGHCTAAGHAVIADVLYRYLTDRNLIP